MQPAARAPRDPAGRPKTAPVPLPPPSLPPRLTGGLIAAAAAPGSAPLPRRPRAPGPAAAAPLGLAAPRHPARHRQQLGAAGARRPGQPGPPGRQGREEPPRPGPQRYESPAWRCLGCGVVPERRREPPAWGVAASRPPQSCSCFVRPLGRPVGQSGLGLVGFGRCHRATGGAGSRLLLFLPV